MRIQCKKCNTIYDSNDRYHKCQDGDKVIIFKAPSKSGIQEMYHNSDSSDRSRSYEPMSPMLDSPSIDTSSSNDFSGGGGDFGGGGSSGDY